MRENENNSVATPLLGAGVLGAGAYGSHKVNSFLENAGIHSGLRLNPEAIKAIEAYAKAVPANMRDQSKFLYRYADLANNASKVRLFDGDPRSAWQWFTNTEQFKQPVSSAGKMWADRIDSFSKKKMPKIEKRMEGLLGKKRSAKFSKFIHSKVLNPLSEIADGTYWMFKPSSTIMSELTSPGERNTAARVMAHEAELGQSKARALIRLMHEQAAEPELEKTVEDLARRTADSIFDYKNTVKKFNNPLEHFRYRYKPPMESVGMGEHAVDSYMRHFEHLYNRKFKNKSEALREVRKILMPTMSPEGKMVRDSSVFKREVARLLGGTGKWKYDEATGKLMQAGKKFKLPDGIKNVKDVQKIIDKSPLLTWLATDASTHYRGEEFGKALKGLRIGQAIRNPKLRMALGLGSAALGGLGLFNMNRNSKAKERNARRKELGIA